MPAWSGYVADSDGAIRHVQASSNNLRSFDVAAADMFSGRNLPTPSQPTWIDFTGAP